MTVRPLSVTQNRPQDARAASRAFDIDPTSGTPGLSSRNPFRGNGFGGTGSEYLPEYTYGRPSVRIPAGAELWRVTPDGSNALTAVFDGAGWRRVAVAVR